jgi:predicted O-methyltransferase YrrM
VSSRSTLERVDAVTAGVPYTHNRVCQLLFELAVTSQAPQIVEIACGYGKATAYLAAAASLRDGFVMACDGMKPQWRKRAADDLVRAVGGAEHCRIDFDSDARWWLLDLVTERTGEWIDLAYLDAAHTVEVDSFLASALWRHLKPGGMLVLDDLDWTASLHAAPGAVFSRPERSHVRALYDYLRALSDVGDSLEWGRSELDWTWGLVLKRSDGGPQTLRERLT